MSPLVSAPRARPEYASFHLDIPESRAPAGGIPSSVARRNCGTRSAPKGKGCGAVAGRRRQATQGVARGSRGRRESALARGSHRRITGVTDDCLRLTSGRGPTRRSAIQVEALRVAAPGPAGKVSPTATWSGPRRDHRGHVTIVGARPRALGAAMDRPPLAFRPNARPTHPPGESRSSAGAETRSLQRPRNQGVSSAPWWEQRTRSRLWDRPVVLGRAVEFST